MLRDQISAGAIHRACFFGLPILLLTHGFALVIVGTPAGEIMSRVMTLLAAPFGGFH